MHRAFGCMGLFCVFWDVGAGAGAPSFRVYGVVLRVFGSGRHAAGGTWALHVKKLRPRACPGGPC